MGINQRKILSISLLLVFFVVNANTLSNGLSSDDNSKVYSLTDILAKEDINTNSGFKRWDSNIEVKSFSESSDHYSDEVITLFIDDVKLVPKEYGHISRIKFYDNTDMKNPSFLGYGKWEPKLNRWELQTNFVNSGVHNV